MALFFLVITLISAYLLGSIPTSVWIGKYFYGIDIRKHGSGNAGTTNTVRVLGWKAGIPVLIVDIFKGFLAVNLIRLNNYYTPSTTDFINFQILLGIAALIGHIFPVYAGFKGGKGVATLFGLVLAINPLPTLISAGIFFITLVITKYVSLSSIVAGFTFPISVIVIFKTTTTSLIIFSLIIAVLLLFTHRKNIARLLKKEEAKFSIVSRKVKNN